VNNLMKRAQHAKTATPTNLEKRTATLKRMGVSNPQTANMNRNVMLSQIETFDRSRLKPLQPQQRYITSPHEDTRNLFSNTLGMSTLALKKDLPAIRPVFKNEDQRKAFSAQVETALQDHPIGPAREQDIHKVTALRQLQSWSSPDNAMANFKGVDTSHGAPIVYTQGHGSPGSTQIKSDDPTEKAVTGRQMAQQLIGMRLPKTSEVRANSCYSGTAVEIPNTAQVRSSHQQQSIDLEHAGDWSKTFAGELQAGLDARVGSYSRVRGYMGPTTQSAYDDSVALGLGGMVKKDKVSGIQVLFGKNPSYDVLRSQAKRYGK
jgi:hypothetical protein